MPMPSPGPNAPRRAHTAGALLVGLCAVSTLTLLVMAPALSGDHSVVAPGPSAPDENTPGTPAVNRMPLPEFRPLPSPGPS
ncbi:hypothetical protein GCM10010383_03380 [Streptomyces lomondensis]|uniref:Secreted protein n=1 Tax=Streptomyces lomondensis TaxID=68229 RepID=A0ABQ2WXZ0_9ACTN|nr:hypothetical protein GCM10010383_03380 [Streptomyces lomondensis]